MGNSVATTPEIENNEFLYTQFQQKIRKAHNKYRRQHGVPDVHLSRALCKDAETIASTCLANRQAIDSPTFGDSIFWVYSAANSGTPSVEEVVNSWYHHKIDHHSQCSPVVWKSTLIMGIAVATDNKENCYVVVNYNPPGKVEAFSFDF